MPMNCTACNAQIEATPDTDVAALRTEAQRLTTSLETAQAQASGYQSVVQERDQLQQQLEARNQRDTRLQTLRDAGVANPEQVLADTEALHTSAMAGRPEAERKGWEDWVKTDAKEHVLLKHAFGASSATTQEGATTQTPGANGAGTGGSAGQQTTQRPAGGATGAPPPPNIAAVVASFSNTGPAAPTEQQYTRADVAAYLNSGAFQALDKDTKLQQVDVMERNLTAWESQDGSTAQF